MRLLRGALARIVGMFDRDRAEADLREEFESHVEMETAENIRRGMEAGEARRQAMLAAGGLAQAAEAVRDRRGLPAIERLVADLGYVLRTLARNRGFTAVVVVTLALGMGANTAIFSVVRGVLLRPLPHQEGDRLVYLRHSTDLPGGANVNFSVPEIRELREGVPSLGGIAEFSTWSMIHHAEEGATRVSVALVTGNYFEVMGLAALHGRVTRPSDDGRGADPVMVLAHDFWMSRFGGDPGIVGERVRLDGRWAEVIGVLQPAPFFPNRVEGLLNMVNSDHHLSASMVEDRTHRMTEVVARLAPGATVERARAEVEAVHARLRESHPEAYEPAARFGVAVIPFREAMGERARMTLWLLMAAAAFVFVIAAANVTNLTLMRGVRREHELVIRAALGAGARRLRRLLLIENLALTLIGAALGVALASGGVGLLAVFAARFTTRADEIRLDGAVLGFTLALAVTLALLLSFAARLPGEDRLATRMAAGVRRMTGGRRGQRLQRGLVVVQVAVSVVLLAGAGLLTRTMIGLANVDTGLVAEEVLTMQVPLLAPEDLLLRPETDGAAKETYERMRAEIAALPGVTAVGLGSTMPLRRSDIAFEVALESRPPAMGEVVPRAEFRTAGPEFFRAAGIPLLQGREFTSADRRDSGFVVIANQELVDRYFPGEDPIGKRIAWTGDVLRFTPFSGDWRTIVGVVGNTRDGGPDADLRPVLYLPFAQELAIAGGLVIRTEGDAAALVPAATRIVRDLAPTTPIENVMTVTQYRARTLAPQRVNAGLLSSFGILALIIVAVGIAGVLAFSVSARTNEIGIRMSLGADPGRVRRMILREGGSLLALGLLLGLGGALLGARLISGLLFGVPPTDTVTFLGVAALMVAIGLGACWVPAHRASRIDPGVTLRAQ
jgi:putative ABC transport system permease protein